MIYLNENTTEIKLPKVVLDSPTKIVLENQLTHSKIEQEIEDSGSTTFYKISIDTTEFETGLYDYYIIGENNTLLSNGIIQFGDYLPENKQYTRDTKIIQYNG